MSISTSEWERVNLSKPNTLDRIHKVLIMDDDPDINWKLSNSLATQDGTQILVENDGEKGLSLIHHEKPDVVLLNIQIPSIDGLNILSKAKSQNSTADFIMISAEKDRNTLIEAIRRGATDFVTKPIIVEDLVSTIRNLLEKRKRQVRPPLMKEPITSQSDNFVLIGESPSIKAVRRMIMQVANSDVPVLILGESGTGKEITARLIHEHSYRSSNAFVKVNCAALPETLLESELFGYEKGAFSGAQTRKPGRFEFAHEGSIFLDEISEMKPSIQAKLLHVLQENEFTLLGGTKNIKVNTRVIGATNRNIEQEIASGNFRDDLYYRINGITIVLPPLRTHKSDILLLMDYFRNKYNKEYNLSYKEFPQVIYEAFMEYNWPGNVRELENYVKRIVIFHHEKEVVDGISRRFKVAFVQPDTFEDTPVFEQEDSPKKKNITLKQCAQDAARKAEKQLIEQTLLSTNWNRTKTAKMLGISYKALLYKIKYCGLDGNHRRVKVKEFTR